MRLRIARKVCKYMGHGYPIDNVGRLKKAVRVWEKACKRFKHYKKKRNNAFKQLLIMAHYIDKDALVAEIERRINKEFGTYLSSKGTLTNLLCYINTLEVKEVDLEKELNVIIDSLNDDKYEHLSIHQQLSYIARHFFELGLKVQKGE